MNNNNSLHSMLIFMLGVCVGYYVLSNIFKKPDRITFERGVEYGIYHYRQDLVKNGNFTYLSDSCLILKSKFDSFVICK